MSDINRVIIEGRLTRDPEFRSSAGGMTIAKLGIASNRRTKEGDKPTFVNVTVFGKTAEFLRDYDIGKGRAVIVDGKLSFNEWDDKATGQKRSVIEILADAVEVRGERTAKAEQEARPVAGRQPELDESIPF